MVIHVWSSADHKRLFSFSRWSAGVRSCRMPNIGPVSTLPSARSTGSRAGTFGVSPVLAGPGRYPAMDIRQNSTSEINGRTSLDVPTVTAAGPPSSFPDQTPAPSVLCRTRAKSSHQCRRQSAATRLLLLPAQPASPHLGTMLTRHPEAGHEILVASVRSAVFEPYPNNFIARRLRAVPGALKRYECIPAILCRELFAIVKH